MFLGCKAWFSQSVESDLINLWESEGGVITTHHHASYLFSSDASHRDTQRIYNSLDYVENKATVFHSSFLKSSTKSKTKNLVSLGHFILPPPSLHEEIRRQIGNFIWEQDNTQEVEQNDKTPCRDNEINSRSIECVTRKEVWKSGSDLSDDVMCHALHNYPVNNMCTGYISIDQMKKFSGELHDFTPDASEYFVFCVQDESNNVSGIKNVLNKKLLN
ncbi:telomere repeats-binding bouquet formation protein 2 [Pseudophryne corroboree]|uniref:telomere repeats-binding bouquet formation protein 2 n=1 Tax=Pseudophryne corroboree TaxID=495146 RepID=UPI003081625C